MKEGRERDLPIPIVPDWNEQTVNIDVLRFAAVLNDPPTAIVKSTSLVSITEVIGINQYNSLTHSNINQ